MGKEKKRALAFKSVEGSQYIQRGSNSRGEKHLEAVHAKNTAGPLPLMFERKRKRSVAKAANVAERKGIGKVHSVRQREKHLFGRGTYRQGEKTRDHHLEIPGKRGTRKNACLNAKERAN